MSSGDLNSGPCACVASTLLTEPALAFLVLKSIPNLAIKCSCKTSVQTPIVGGFLCHLDSKNVQMCCGLGDAGQTLIGSALRASVFALSFALAWARRHIATAIANAFQDILKKDFLAACRRISVSGDQRLFYSFLETHKDEWKNVAGT